MTTFTIIAAVMILIALALLAPALLRKRQLAASDRDQQNVMIARERLEEMELDLTSGKVTQDEFDQAKMELEQALLQDLEQEDGPGQVSAGPGKLTLGGIAVAVPVIAISMYMLLGTPEMVEFDASKRVPHNSSKQQAAMPSKEQMLATLKQRLQEKPDDAEGWFLLGRTYMMLDEYPKAVQAYETLLKLSGEESTIMLSLADALTMVQGGSMQGRPAELIRKSIKAEPDSQTALWMGGMLESQQGNYAQAIAHWKKLESMLGDEPEAQEKVRSMITMLEGIAAPATPNNK